MKEKIISLKNKTIYKLIGLLGLFMPLSYIVFGYETGPSVLVGICVAYILVMLVFLVIRSRGKKAMDVPSLVGIAIPLVIIALILMDFFP